MRKKERLRLTGLLSYKGFKLVLSVTLALITYAVGLSLAIALKGPIYLPIIAALVVGFLTYKSSDAASKELMYYINNLYQKINEINSEYDIELTQDNDEEKELISNDEENLFMVHNLIKSITNEINKDVKEVIMEIYRGDLAMIYPEINILDNDNDISNDLSYNYPQEGSTADYLNGNLIIRMRYEDFDNLLSSLKKGDGEIAVFSNLNELRSLYNITKIITKATLEEDSDELVSYITYKAIISLKRKGAINISDNIIEEIPFESKELRKKIKEQIKEERGALY
ncbi:hypothetical protein [Caldisphaera sp.]|uniref:hypothetical protein n=1 Tax=Caldisphaera sp. TaxID=2060322 RepID=UPI0025BB07F3|nr:hypothetical protein [Caldisphaera sp.]